MAKVAEQHLRVCRGAAMHGEAFQAQPELDTVAALGTIALVVREAVYVRDRELAAVQVRDPFRRLLGDVANHVRMVNGPGAIVRRSQEVVEE